MREPSESDRGRLAAAEGIEAARTEILSLRGALERAPHWRPARGLIARCDEALGLIEDMRKRLRRKLVVAIVGPTGAGKSTLLSALAGVDRLSVAGNTRPTTRNVVVFCRDPEDAAPLAAAVGADRIQVVTSPAAQALEHVVLVDTPDTNSALLAEHRPIVEAVIGQADALVCLFNAQNPKGREDIDYLAPLVAGFPSDLVLAVVNQADRQDRKELEEEILPDFREHLQRAWGRRLSGVYAVSARAHLHQPNWPADARPRSDLDQFDALHAALFGSMNRASLVVDARLARTRHLVELVREAVRERAAACREPLEAVKEGLVGLRKDALKEAVSALESSGSEAGLGTDAVLYQRLAQLWWGPVGWSVGLWGRIILMGTGILHALRFGNPLRQLWGTVSAAVRFNKTSEAVSQARQGVGLDVALYAYRATVERNWPDLAEQLVGCDFDPSVRETRALDTDGERIEAALEEGWARAFRQAIEKAARLLSLWPLQLVLNALVLVPLGVITWESVTRFADGQILSWDYFRHGLVTVALLWLLSFVVLQIGARLAGGPRLLKRTFGRLTGALDEPTASIEAIGLVSEVDVVRGLASRGPNARLVALEP